MVFFFGGMGLIGGGIWLATDKAMPLAWPMVPLGAVSLAWGIYSGLYCSCVAENRWIERRLRTEISHRPDALVDPRSGVDLCFADPPRISPKLN